MGLKHVVKGVDAAAFGNPTYFATKEGFTATNLVALYLFDADDGALDATLTAFTDKSGNANHGSLVTNYGGIVRKAYGAQVNDHAFGLRIATGVPITPAGHVYIAFRSAMGEGEDNFPFLFARSNQIPDPNFGPHFFWNADVSANHKRLGMIDKSNITLPAAQYIALASGTVDTWQVAEYAWDGPGGTQEVRNLLAGVGPTADADFTTQNAADVTAGYTMQPGLMRYQTALSNVKGEVGCIALYNAALSPEERTRNRLNAARIMVARDAAYTPQGYAP